MFQKKSAPSADADALSPSGDDAMSVSPAVSLGGGKTPSKNPSKKTFGGPRTMTAGGGGGSKFGGFRKGGGVTSFSGGKR